MNWDYADVNSSPVFGSRTPREIESFLQAWLFFGCVTQVLTIAGIKAKSQEFILDAENGKIITTQKLGELIEKWRRSRPGQNPIKERNQIRKILDRVQRFVNSRFEEFEKYTRDYEKANPDSDGLPVSWPKISLSITAIGWTLQRVADKIYKGGPPRVYKWRTSDILIQRLQEQGWCEGEVILFTKRLELNVDTLYYFGSLHSSRADQDHSACTARGCVGKVPGTKPYDVKHVRNDCDCEMVKVDIAGVIKTIERNAIPLLSWCDTGIEVIEYDPRGSSRKNYVAISHVSAPFPSVTKDSNL